MSERFDVLMDLEHRRYIVGGEPMIFHCHHYNTFLQRSILDAEAVDSRPFLIGAAAELSHAQLKNVFAATGEADPAARKAVASDLYRWAGFGVLDLEPLGADGGTCSTPHSHYGMGWKIKFGTSERPVAYFDCGWLAGALAAIYDQPLGTYRVDQMACLSTGAAQSSYTLTRGEPNYTTFASVGVGPLTEHEPLPLPPNNVDAEGILAAISQLPLVGDEDGNIPAFGVYLTRMYANYYNRISFELERALEASFGATGREVAQPLLIESGHVCAFNTFGGIMTSTEWDALIRPTLKTNEDWIHGIVAVVNCLGWGRWQATEVSAERAVFAIHDDYESIGYQAMYGTSDHPISYLAMGGVTGAMNLVYLGNIMTKPALTHEYYQRLFRETDVYRARPLTSQAMGGAYTSFEVTRGAAP